MFQKITTSALAILLLAYFLLPSHVAAQALHRGQYLVEGFYGYPNLLTILTRDAMQADPANSTVKVAGFGAIGIRFQYMLTRRLSVGTELCYAQTTASYNLNDLDAQGNSSIVRMHVIMPRPRVLARVEYHLLQRQAYEAYVAAGAGYNAGKMHFTASDPTYFDRHPTDHTLPFQSAFSYRLAFGGRYFPSPHIGLSAEVAIGGPLITGGFCLRLGQPQELRPQLPSGQSLPRPHGPGIGQPNVF